MPNSSSSLLSIILKRKNRSSSWWSWPTSKNSELINNVQQHTVKRYQNSLKTATTARKGPTEDNLSSRSSNSSTRSHRDDEQIVNDGRRCLEKTMTLSKNGTASSPSNRVGVGNHNTTVTLSNEKTSTASLSSLSGATTSNSGPVTPSLNKCLPISSRISRYQQHCQQARVTSSGGVGGGDNPKPAINQFNSISIIEVFFWNLKKKNFFLKRED